MGSVNLKELNDVKVKEDYLANISSRFVALLNLGESVGYK
jgi:hypothetical protein